jgi:hypothetical protein
VGLPLVERCGRTSTRPRSCSRTTGRRTSSFGASILDHRVINHSAGIYVRGDTHTNTIEGFFGNLKTGMRGAYKHVSPRYLQSYLDEYAFRYNHRHDGGMFEALVGRATRA